MEQDNLIAVEGDTMILRGTDRLIPTEFSMPDVDSVTDDMNAPIDLEDEDAIDGTLLVPLRTLMDIDNIVSRHTPSAESLSHTPTVQHSSEQVRTKKAKEPYRRYTVSQMEQLFNYVIERGKNAEEVAISTGIKIRTAQHYIKKYNDDKERLYR
jgi:hypothetical protein